MSYYTNGHERADDAGPPNRETFAFWYGPSAGNLGGWEPPADPANPYWRSDARVVVARRELFRRMGGKPRYPAGGDDAAWQQYAVKLVLAMYHDPCAAFSSRRASEAWDWSAWAAFCNWYAYLDPKYRQELLADVGAGRCARWMPVALDMRRYAPSDTMYDPTYQLPNDFDIAQVGDDPWIKPSGVGASTPCQECMYCALANPRPAFCLAGDYTAPSWPVVTQIGSLAIPGLPAPCSPFPQCVRDMLPAAPCSPWPDCAFQAAQAVASATPGAVVTRTAQGATYVPAEPTAPPPAAAPPPTAAPTWIGSNWPWLAGGAGGLALLGVIAAAASRKPSGPSATMASEGAVAEGKARFKVPKGQIDWLVGRVHVGTPDQEVRADIESRCQKSGMTAPQIRACGDYAVKSHHRNLDLYQRVMSGRL